MGDLILLSLSIVWNILSIVLFFKVWGACDNIKRLAEKYAPEAKKNTPESSDEIDKKNTPESRDEIDKWLKEE